MGWIYQFANGGGAAIFFKGGSPCTTSHGNYDYKEFALDEEQFDNLTSSLNDYNGCDTQLAQYANFQGDLSGGADGWFNAGNGNPYNLDVWDNRTSSIRWS